MQTIPDGMVRLPDAARMACFEAGLCGAISQQHLEESARRLSRILTIYALPADGEAADPRAISDDELQAALRDGRPPMRELAVTSAALRAALKLFRPAPR